MRLEVTVVHLMRYQINVKLVTKRSGLREVRESTMVV